jgi:hypothetical protein
MKDLTTNEVSNRLMGNSQFTTYLGSVKERNAPAIATLPSRVLVLARKRSMLQNVAWLLLSLSTLYTSPR